MPCIPQQKDSGACPLTNRTWPGYRPNHTISADQSSEACHHIVSGLALATCRRGVVWSRRCRTHVSVGGLLSALDGRHRVARTWACSSSRGRGGADAQMPAREVVL